MRINHKMYGKTTTTTRFPKHFHGREQREKNECLQLNLHCLN